MSNCEPCERRKAAIKKFIADYKSDLIYGGILLAACGYLFITRKKEDNGSD
jgi:hypothetical protein